MIKNTRKLVSIIILLNLIISISGCKPKQVEINRSGTYFDTIITITLYNANESKYIDGCFKLAQKYENYFSTTIPTSDIAKINSSNGNPVSVHKDTIDIIKKSLKYSNETNGLFDITVGKLSKLWKEAIESKTLPNEKEIESAKSTIDYKKIKINGNTVSIAPDQALDLGGIAKGYIADKMGDYLKKHNIKSGLINLGGNILTLDKKPDNKPYTIGIKKPFTDNTPIDSVECTNTSVVTSGRYERFFRKNGIIYHHIINPITGMPCDNNLDSVTIITKKSIDADALSTSFFLMGEKEIEKYIDNHDNIEVRLINKDGKIKTLGGVHESNR